MGVTGQHYTRIFMFLQDSNLCELLPYREKGQFPGKQLLNPYHLQLRTAKVNHCFGLL